MAVISAQVTIKSSTDQVEDHAVNTFHFQNNTVLGDVDNIADMLVDFYNVAPGGQANGIAQFMSPGLTAQFSEIKLYNLDDAKPRAPIYTREFELLTTGTASAIPQQCAIVATYETAPVSGQNQRRYRNRIYLPFWKNTTVSAQGMVSSTVRDVIAAAMAEMKQASDASISNTWMVFSPTRATAGGTPEDGLAPVDQGWVDDSFDIQRRRKVDPTSRRPWDDTGLLPIVTL